MKSILQDENDKDCFFLSHFNENKKHPINTYQALHKHHVFSGPNRKMSEKYGLYVNLCCYRCHNGGPHSVHMERNAGLDLQLKQYAQLQFENHQYRDFHGSREKFREIFGKSYL